MKSLTSKILLSYLLVVAVAFSVAIMSFYPIMIGFLDRRAKIGLEKQAWEIAFYLDRERSGAAMPHEDSLPLSILLLGRSVETDYLALDPQDMITDSSVPQQFPIQKRLTDLPVKLRENGSYNKNVANIYETRDYLSVEVPIGASTNSNGTVLTFIPLETLNGMQREMMLAIIRSLFIALAVALLVAYFLGRYLVRPLKALEHYAQSVAERRFDMRFEVTSDDELGRLAKAFNNMADQLESYDLRMRRFFQNNSHELKTPLMSIQGYAEGIKDGIFTGPKMQNAVEVICKESQRLRKLVDQIIDISILEHPQESTYLLPHDLKTILDEVIESVGGYALEKNVRLQADVEPGIWVIGDWDKLQRMFVNLLSNAIRHSWGSVVVEASAVQSSGQVVVKVQDDGPGFSPVDLEHAFDYFYKGSDEGSGLGLSIVSLIVKEHGGTIRIYNSDSGGAVVEVTLPVLMNDK
ncbi:MAG: HAMP domain-containing histidine kinase [Firmicutes bacterium]|nr:HAMP domain-containing histidine kinase [Bacillota bacterium]